MDLNGFLKLNSLLSISMKECVQYLSHRNDPVLSYPPAMLELDYVLNHSKKESEVTLAILPVKCFGECIV